MAKAVTNNAEARRASRVGHIRLVAGLALCPLIAHAADADSIAQPDVKVGDSWVFRQTTEKAGAPFSERTLDLSVERVGDEDMMVSVKQDGAPGNPEEHLVGLDWRQIHNLKGEQTTIGKPLSFPLKVGKTWVIDFTDPTTYGRQRSAHFHTVYRVVGWEDVETPAGKFHALKIEANGDWKGELAPQINAATRTSASANGAIVVNQTHVDRPATIYGTSYSTFYYVPGLKQLVKTTADALNKDNVRIKHEVRVLESYKLQP